MAKILWNILIVGAILSGVSAGKGRASCAEVRRAFMTKGVGPMKIVPFKAITSEFTVKAFV